MIWSNFFRRAFSTANPHYEFVLQWPLSYVLWKKDVNPAWTLPSILGEISSEKKLKIHGLRRPSMGGLLPSKAATNPSKSERTYDNEMLQYLFSKDPVLEAARPMLNYLWPDLSGDVEFALWSKQFNKHGLALGLDPVHFFTLAIKLATEVDRCGIFPLLDGSEF